MELRKRLENLNLPPYVRLVAVTKTFPVETIIKCIDAGIKEIGENYVQEAENKFAIIGNKVKWHMIGHLQRNKVKKAVKIFDMIQTVDSYKIAEKINEECLKIGKIMPVLVQVNVSGDKFGIDPEEVHIFLKELSTFENIRVKGLMCIASFSKPRDDFRRMKSIFDKAGLEILSMGMSDDYRIAIEEGSNMVRIGRALFGERLN